MKPFEKFLENNSSVRELLDIYLELRQHLYELGFGESDLEKPPIYTTKMMKLQEKFNGKKNTLFRLIRDYGFDISHDQLVQYLMPLIEKINELIPMNNGNYKGGSKGNQDY
jgi:hypothetical protein